MDLNEYNVKTLDFGGGTMVEIDYLVKTLGIKRHTAALYLKALRIKPIYIGNNIYFSLPTFKRIMFVLGLPGSPGFLFPGSRGKGNKSQRGQANESLCEVTDEILAKAADPRTLAEMAAADGKDPAILKKFVTAPVGRPKKGKDNESV